MTYGRLLLLGLTLFIVGGAIDGRMGAWLAVAAFVGTPVAALIYLTRYPSGLKDSDTKLAAVEQLPEADESSTKWERRQRLTRDWRHATPSQGAEVRRLVKEHRGALVRNLPDGATEVLTGKDGGFVRYAVSEEGTSTVAESIPSDSAHVALGRIALGGLVVFVLSWPLGALLDGTRLEWLFAVLAFGGFVVAMFAFLGRGASKTESGALLQTKRGERWTSLGYPDD